MKEITAETIDAIRRNLVDFGYGGLTPAFVKAQVDLVMSGEAPQNIIGMFWQIKDMLEKNAYLVQEEK